jgi:hypothetical protein
VDPGATLITFGAMATSGGSAWFDDLDLAVEVNGKWTSVPIQDPGFETRDVFASWTAGTGAPASSIEGWDVTLDTERPATGSVALRMQRTVEVVTAELFAESPAPGETVDIDLGSGLRARVPIALYSSDGHTIGDDPAQAEKPAATGERTDPSGFDRIATIADVVVLWNALRASTSVTSQFPPATSDHPAARTTSVLRGKQFQGRGDDPGTRRVASVIGTAD